MLARRSATEIFAHQQHRSALVSRLVKHEIRIAQPLRTVLPWLARVEIAPLVEQIRTESAALDGFQELLRQDGVRIHIGTVNRRHQPIEYCEGLHADFSCSTVLTSTKCPATAAAAAICGLTRWVRPPGPCLPSKLRLDVDAQRSPGA